MPPSQDRNKHLTEKEHGAALHYLRFGVKADAYRALYDCGRMKSRTVHRRAIELFAKPNVTVFVEKHRTAMIEAAEAKQERIVQALAAIAFTDITEVAHWDGELLTVREPKDLSPAQRAAIKKVKKNAGRVEVEMHDKLAALRLLGTWKQMFVKRHEVSATGPVQFILNMDTPSHVGQDIRRGECFSVGVKGRGRQG
jgi:phage terminase small subunit